MQKNNIDFVITWLDPSDPEWQKAYRAASASEKYHNVADFSPERYRDWNNLKYWFRGVEKHAPWVNKVHFVTHGHLPAWLNTEHKQLNIVKHSDYIDEKYLPTFNSRVLELNLVNLGELAEQFVIFNDDFFIIDDLQPDMFFKAKKPRDFAVLNAYSGDGLAPILMNNLNILNQEFQKKEVLKNNTKKWFNIKYKHHLLRTMLLLAWPRFTGFIEPHLPQPYLKSNLLETWKTFGHKLAQTCESQFRLSSDVNHYLFRYHHLVSGNFSPITPYALGMYFDISDKNYIEAASSILKKQKPLITINDSDMEDFETIRESINSSLDTILPEKSQFEL